MLQFSAETVQGLTNSYQTSFFYRITKGEPYRVLKFALDPTTSLPIDTDCLDP